MNSSLVVFFILVGVCSAQTSAPTAAPTSAPTSESTSESTSSPTSAPTSAPTSSPTSSPNFLAPTAAPAAAQPTAAPTAAPAGTTGAPTAAPAGPTAAPTAGPAAPTSAPTAAPEGGSSNTPSPTPAPTAAQVETVVLTMTVENVDFAGLQQNETLMDSFKSEIAKSIAAQLGVQASNVVVTLTDGSVNVRAEITPPAGMTAAALKETVSSDPDAFKAALVTAIVNNVAGLEAVKTGEIVVSGVQAAVEISGSGSTNATTTASETIDDETSGAFKSAVLSMVTMVALTLFAQ